MIEALYNAVVVQPIELEETTYGNIVVPDLGNEKNKTAYKPKSISAGKAISNKTDRLLFLEICW